MDIKKANLNAALEEIQNNYEIELRPGYQGRFNNTAEVAVVGERQALEEFELVLAGYTVVDNLDFEEVDARELLNAIIDVRDMRREDNMGMDMIFYYPHIAVED